MSIDNEKIKQLQKEICNVTGIPTTMFGTQYMTATEACLDKNSSRYIAYLNGIQQNTIEVIKRGVVNLILYITNFQGWDRYPRKTKKMLKKKGLWEYTKYNLHTITSNDVNIRFNRL